MSNKGFSVFLYVNRVIFQLKIDQNADPALTVNGFTVWWFEQFAPALPSSDLLQFASSGHYEHARPVVLTCLVSLQTKFAIFTTISVSKLFAADKFQFM